MRSILIAILVIAVGFGLFLALSPSAPSDLESAKVGDAVATTTAPVATTTAPSGKQAALTSFTFTGYGPGKEHVGTFKDWTVTNVTLNQADVPTAGKFTIKTASVDTTIDGLNKHLCTPDFFDCAAHPEIIFDLVKVTHPATPIFGDSATLSVTGNLTFNNVTKEFTFPVSIVSDGTFSADFKFDTTFFNFKYVGIDKEVRIQFAGELK